MRRIFLTALLLTGCGAGPSPHNIIDKEFNKFIEQFYKDVGMWFGGSIVLSSDAEFIANVVGTCDYTQLTSKKNTVRIKASFYNKATKETKTALLYHELGHCALGLDHDSRIIFNSYDTMSDCPNSIMHPTLVSDECIKANWQHYIEELRKPGLGY